MWLSGTRGPGHKGPWPGCTNAIAFMLAARSRQLPPLTHPLPPLTCSNSSSELPDF